MPTHDAPSFPSSGPAVVVGGNSSAGRARPSQGRCRGFESHFPLSPRVQQLLARCEVSADGCLLWPGAKNLGYGVAKVSGRCELLHRVIWIAKLGPIEGELTIDHLCHVRHCLNVEHMELVSLETNGARGNGASQLYCHAGHPMFGTLGRWTRRGGGRRRCLICRSAYRLENRIIYNAQQLASRHRREARAAALDVASHHQSPEAAP